MTLKSILFIGCAMAIGTATLLVGSFQSDEDRPNIMRQHYAGLDVEFFRNSATLSQAVSMNSAGAIVGYREIQTDVIKQVYFYCGKAGCKDMPIPKGFTNVEAAAISDTEMVVGRAMKPIGNAGSLQPVVWSPASGEIRLLPTPSGDGVADATDITPDGKRITGYATGSDRLRPVVWEWNATELAWRVEVLPTLHENNPYLMSSHLVISPDGNTIAGCCTESMQADGSLKSSLYAWSRMDGKWTRRLVSPEHLYVKALNNKGEMVGSVFGIAGRQPCVVAMDGKLKLLELVKGDVAGEARDINEDSIIVGWSDAPPQSDGGPTPCTWTTDGKITPLKFSEHGFAMLFAINAKGQMAGTADLVTKPATSPNANDEETAMLAVRVSKQTR